MRILVTGAGGYIGRYLVPRLLAEGHEVWGAFHSVWASRNTPHTYWCGDLSSPGALQVAGTGLEHPDTVIHLAGRVDINLLPNPEGVHLPPVPGPCDIGALYRDNVLATANVLQYCLLAGVKHLIFASTQAVYGMPERDEPSTYLREQPLEHYAASKLAAEKLLLIGALHNLSVSVLRLPGVFGGARKDGTVYNMCRDALQKGEIHVTHPYPLPMNVMHVEDVVDALVRLNPQLANADLWRQRQFGTVMDIGGRPEPCSLDILADEIASLVSGCKVKHGEYEHPVMDVFGFTSHVSLGWIPKPRKERLAQVLEEIRRE